MMGLWHRYKVYFVYACLSVLIGMLIVFLFQGCGNPDNPDNPDTRRQEVVSIDVFTLSTEERQQRINVLYNESRQMNDKKGYISDSLGGYRVQALLMQLEISVLIYAESLDR